MTMIGDNYDVDGERGTARSECETCGDEYDEPADLKADSGECPSCSGGDLS